MYEELVDTPLTRTSPCTTTPAANPSKKQASNIFFFFQKIQLYENSTYILCEMPVLSSASFFQHHYEGIMACKEGIVSITNNTSIDLYNMIDRG